MLSEENDFCGINRACLKGSAEIKDLHLSAIKYDRKQSPEGHGIFACKELFQTVLKLIMYFQICLRFFMKAVGNTVARFQPITALDCLRIDCSIFSNSDINPKKPHLLQTRGLVFTFELKMTSQPLFYCCTLLDANL